MALYLPRIKSEPGPLAVAKPSAGPRIIPRWCFLLPAAVVPLLLLATLGSTPTSVTYALDMGVLVPACYVTAFWLWRRKPLGYVLAAMLLVMTTLIDLVGVPLSLVMGAPGPAAIMGILAAAGLAVTVWFFRSLGENRGHSNQMWTVVSTLEWRSQEDVSTRLAEDNGHLVPGGD